MIFAKNSFTLFYNAKYFVFVHAINSFLMDGQKFEAVCCYALVLTAFGIDLTSRLFGINIIILL